MFGQYEHERVYQYRIEASNSTTFRSKLLQLRKSCLHLRPVTKTSANRPSKPSVNHWMTTARLTPLAASNRAPPSPAVAQAVSLHRVWYYRRICMAVSRRCANSSVRASERHVQDITALTIVLQNHRVVFPQRGPMRYCEERDTQTRGMLHHHALHVWWNQRRSFV